MPDASPEEPAAPAAATDRLLSMVRSAGPDAEVQHALEEALADLDPTLVVQLRDAGTEAAGFTLTGCPPVDVHPTAAALVAAATAIVVARGARAEVELDPLTGALSRKALHRRIDEQLARAARDQRPLTCGVLDVDAFKPINDTFGHLTGDVVLRCVVDALQATVRPFDVVGRFGGDEFVVCLEGVSRFEVPATAARLLDAIRARTQAAVGRDITCSMGFAVAAPGCDRVELLQDADAALRRAKRSNTGSFEIAGPRLIGLDGGGIPSPAGTGDLRAAMRGDTSVRFQPIVGLEGTDGMLVGFEALTQGPGTLSRPDVLLEHARRAGQLVALDEELHRRALQHADAQGMLSPLSLFVNVEAETLVRIVGDDRFWRRTTARFASVSEITERALLERPGALLHACARLRELGWGIALDDIDVDSRALSLLPLIAPDVIKLDLQVVQDDDFDSQAEVMMAVSAQRHHGGARLLAEGIETEAHRRRAHALGADYGQGYLLGRPTATMPATTATGSVPRTLGPPLLRGVTPFQLLCAERPIRRGPTVLIDAVQRTIERRAQALGVRAAVVSSFGEDSVAAAARPRLRALAAEVGMVGLIRPALHLGDIARAGLHEVEMATDDPRRQEWTTVILCAEHSAVLSARRVAPGSDEWEYALEHDRQFALAVAHDLVSHLP